MNKELVYLLYKLHILNFEKLQHDNITWCHGFTSVNCEQCNKCVSGEFLSEKEFNYLKINYTEYFL